MKQVLYYIVYDELGIKYVNLIKIIVLEQALYVIFNPQVDFLLAASVLNYRQRYNKETELQERRTVHAFDPFI